MQAVGYTKEKDKATGKGTPKAPTMVSGKRAGSQGGKRPQKVAWGSADPGHLPCKCHNCGEKGHKVANCGKDTGNDRSKKGIYGVDDGAIEEEGSQYLGD